MERGGEGKAARAHESIRAAAHSIQTEAARNQSSLPNGIPVISTSLVASVDSVSQGRNRFSILCSLSSLTALPHQQIVELSK
jgi:hypothetical protein